MISSLSYKMFITHHLVRIYRCIYSSEKSLTMCLFSLKCHNSTYDLIQCYCEKCVSIGVRMPANVWLYKYCIPLLNDQSFLDWRKLCWSNWGAKSNICESLLWSSNNMCTTVTWYCLTSREFMFFINSHSIDNNRMCVLNLYLLNCLFKGFKIIIPLFF